MVNEIGLYFAISSVANAAWIFSWHYRKIVLTLIWMLVIFICLVAIVLKLGKLKLSRKSKLFAKLPFSVYFGWITVATIANVTVALVSMNWNGWGISEPVWMVIITLVGLVIGVASVLYNQDAAYGLVLIWAYAGILLKHLSPNGFDSQYPGVIIAVSLSIIILFVVVFYTVVRHRSPL